MHGRVPRMFLALAALLALAAPQHYVPTLHLANESVRVYEALAIVQHGTLDLAPVFDQFVPGWRKGGTPPNLDVTVRNGRYLLDKAYSGSAAQLVLQALSDRRTSAEELREIRKLLDTYEAREAIRPVKEPKERFT